MIRHAGPDDVSWLVSRTAYDPPPGFCGLVAVGEDGAIRGLIGFDRWTPSSACMHAAIDVPAACRGLLREAFTYLFRDTGRAVARAEVRAGNERSMRATAHLGFQETSRVVDGWAPGEDLVLFELRRGDCRWMDAEQERMLPVVPFGTTEYSQEGTP